MSVYRESGALLPVVALVALLGCAMEDGKEQRGDLYRLGQMVRVRAGDPRPIACKSGTAFIALLEARAASDPEGVAYLIKHRECAEMPIGASLRVLRIDSVQPRIYKVRLFRDDKTFVVWTEHGAIDPQAPTTP